MVMLVDQSSPIQTLNKHVLVKSSLRIFGSTCKHIHELFFINVRSLNEIVDRPYHEVTV